MPDQRVGGTYDHFAASVVLLKLERKSIRIIPLEIQDVPDIGPAESIDALGIISHHTDIFVPTGQHLHDEILRVIGILVLINQQVPEALLIPGKYVGEFAQEFVGPDEQIVEIHGCGPEATIDISFIDFACFRPPAQAILFGKFRNVPIRLRA